MTQHLIDQERRRWDRQPEWNGTTPQRPPMRKRPVLNGWEEALREHEYRARADRANRLKYNPLARM